jgi:hypothetical protein
MGKNTPGRTGIDGNELSEPGVGLQGISMSDSLSWRFAYAGHNHVFAKVEAV